MLSSGILCWGDKTPESNSPSPVSLSSALLRGQYYDDLTYISHRAKEPRTGVPLNVQPPRERAHTYV